MCIVSYSEVTMDSSELTTAYEILAPFLDGGKVRASAGSGIA